EVVVAVDERRVPQDLASVAERRVVLGPREGGGEPRERDERDGGGRERRASTHDTSTLWAGGRKSSIGATAGRAAGANGGAGWAAISRPASARKTSGPSPARSRSSRTVAPRRRLSSPRCFRTRDARSSSA